MKLTKTGTNNGGVCKIEVVDAARVIATPNVLNGRAYGTVTLAKDTHWEELYHTEDTAMMVEENVDEHYHLRVRWQAPKDSIESMAYLLALQRKRWIARLTNTNGTVFIAGTVAEPCRVKHTMRDNGRNFVDSNHYNLEIDLRRADPIAIYQAE